MIDRSVLAVFCHSGRHEVEYVANLTDAVLDALRDRPGFVGLALPSVVARPECGECGSIIEALAIAHA